VWAGGAEVDFVTGPHVQRKRLVCHRLFQQDETPIGRSCGLWCHREERDRCRADNRPLHVVDLRSLNGDAFILSLNDTLFIGYIVQLELTECAYRLAVAFFFTGCFAGSLAVDLAEAFEEASALLALLCAASSRRCKLVITSVFSRLTRFSSSK
jgi:hypothetical protein